MADLQLSLAVDNCDHIADLFDGIVKPEGIEITYMDVGSGESRYRLNKFQEFDIAEMSFAKYVSRRSQGDDDIIALPVYSSRMFRHSSIYLRTDSHIKNPEDLAGKRIGVPEWAQTATVYPRGYLAHEVGIDLAGIDWYQAANVTPGRDEKVDLKLPDRLRLTPVADKTLDQMILAGALDAVISARPLDAFMEGDARIRRLFPNSREVEAAHFAETGIFPIMHIVCMRGAVLAEHPWAAESMLRAFCEAKNNCLQRCLSVPIARFPVPWIYNDALDAQAVFGEDFWPYGVERNLPTLTAFLDYAYEQGICHRHLTPADIFPKEILDLDLH